ncbi:hypothetical protein H0H93_004333, partial [Arthromyces matolae]
DDVAALRTLTDDLGYYWPIGSNVLVPHLPHRKYAPTGPTVLATATNVAGPSTSGIATNVASHGPSINPTAIPLPPSPSLHSASLATIPSALQDAPDVEMSEGAQPTAGQTSV